LGSDYQDKKKPSQPTKFKLIQAFARYVMEIKGTGATEIFWKLISRRLSIKLDLDYPK
jgi:hypothetical protein